MNTVRITKEFRFESAHALIGYDGKCRHIHGHSYVLYVTVKGIPAAGDFSPKAGMLMDFTDLKRIVNDVILCKYDHSMVMQTGSPLTEEISQNYGNVMVLPFRPTCENLIIHFASELGKFLPDLYSLRLYETATSYAEWFAEDNA